MSTPNPLGHLLGHNSCHAYFFVLLLFSGVVLLDSSPFFFFFFSSLYCLSLSFSSSFLFFSLSFLRCSSALSSALWSASSCFLRSSSSFSLFFSSSDLGAGHIHDMNPPDFGASSSSSSDTYWSSCSSCRVAAVFSAGGGGASSSVSDSVSGGVSGGGSFFAFSFSPALEGGGMATAPYAASASGPEEKLLRDVRRLEGRLSLSGAGTARKGGLVTAAGPGSGSAVRLKES
mmetsp:Transcript_27148/g.59323  ORF Transcript_27148/g.59323 Transcript_27148/m.59323 type:complete len:231 (-) Transcript_27148:199-891(-)